MSKITRSWQLLKASFKVATSNKSLFAYPAIGLGVALLLTAVTAPVGVLIYNLADGNDDAGMWKVIASTLIVFFVYVMTIVGVFISGALYAASAKALEGEKISLRVAFGLAWQKRSVLIRWGIFSATVGLIISLISSLTERLFFNKLGLIGRIFPQLIGTTFNLAWSLATVFAVPVVMEQHLQPWQAVKHSAGLFKKTWGEKVAADVTFGIIALTILTLAGFLVVGINGLIYLVNPEVPTIIFPIVYGIVAGSIMIIFILVTMLSQAIFTAALYRYAETGDYVGPYTKEMVEGAYKKQKTLI